MSENNDTPRKSRFYDDDLNQLSDFLAGTGGKVIGWFGAALAVGFVIFAIMGLLQ